MMTSKAARVRPQHTNLVKQYRPIGPPAIAAAVAALKKRNRQSRPPRPIRLPGTKSAARGT